MKKALFTSKGQSIELGRQLGKGGEGTVYEVTANPKWVAKIYHAHHQPDSHKQAKLSFMASTADEALLTHSAWPQETLHNTVNGPVIGFLMPKVGGRTPIHMLYSPTHRRQDYPQAAWDFLLFVARNTAAAFSAIHQHGHVLGDVNQGNVLIGADSKVVLIDTDSIQINAHGALHLCTVGVAHFTPPELQGIARFDVNPRTSNHDNFGLAVLIFHLLFGGRHPYSGVPLRKDAGEALEKDIQAFRYAYAPDGKRRGFKPPPRSIPVSIIPEPIQAMFVRAFTEVGATGSRPTSQEWVNTLEGLRSNLKSCAVTRIHRYSTHLVQCPWCEMDAQGVILFVGVSTASPIGTGFDLAKIWKEIEAVPEPPGILWQGSFWQGSIIFIASVPIFIGTWTLLYLLIAPLVVFWLWNIVGNRWGGTECKDYVDKEQELNRLSDAYEQLDEREKDEIAALHQTAYARQELLFLSRQYIENAGISGIGPAKLVALQSYGIETAADVDDLFYEVVSVPGFGVKLTQALMDWKQTCESQFRFNPQKAVTAADENQVRTKIAADRRPLEALLKSGAVELKRIGYQARLVKLRPWYMVGWIELIIVAFLLLVIMGFSQRAVVDLDAPASEIIVDDDKKPPEEDRTHLKEKLLHPADDL